MKKIILLLIFSQTVITGIFGQEQPLTFNRVIQVDSVNKDDIYNTLIEWVGRKYKYPESAMRLNDRNAGIIIVPITVSYRYDGSWINFNCYQGEINYRLTLRVREGRFKAEVSNIIHSSAGACVLGLITVSEKCTVSNINTNSNNQKVWNDIQVKMKTAASNLFDSLENLDFTQDDW